MSRVSLEPAQQVRVVQTVRTRAGPWQTQVEGKVMSCESRPTGSWFAHGKHDRFWLQRLRLQKADGEVVDLILDPESVISVI